MSDKCINRTGIPMSREEAKTDAERAICATPATDQPYGRQNAPVEAGPCGTVDCTPDACEDVCTPAEALLDTVWPMCGPPNRDAQAAADKLYHNRGLLPTLEDYIVPLTPEEEGMEPVYGEAFLCCHGEDECDECWFKTESDEAWQAYADLLNLDLEVLDMVNQPPHYNSHPSGVECIEITEWMNFCIGNAVKYLWRADSKGNALEDLRKAEWYVKREIARREADEAKGG